MRRYPVFCLVLGLLFGAGRFVFAQADQRIIYASVLDKNGAPVTGLGEKDFIIREDGLAREILSVVPDQDPLQVALMVDTSGPMRDNVLELRWALAAFVDNTRPGVQIELITLGARPTVRLPYTSDHAALKKSIDSLYVEPGSGNTLLDGISEMSVGLERRQNARSVMAAITGPDDLSYSESRDVPPAFTASGAALHVLRLGPQTTDHLLEMVLSKATSATGGRNEIVLSPMALPARAAQLAKEISSQYRVTFARPPRLIPPKKTEISARNPDFTARGMLMKSARERQ